jgi:hypothetical protein
METAENNYGTMKPADLVVHFNDLVDQIHETGRGEAFKKVTRFADLATGIKRCEALEKALAVAQENPNPDGPLTEEKDTNGTSAVGADDNKESEPMSEEKKKPAGKKAAGKKAAGKKAAGKKAAKPAAAGPAKKRTAATAGDGPFPMVRAGTNRDLAIKRLLKADGAPVKLTTIVTAVYGADAAASGEAKGQINMVLKGIANVIAENKLPFKLDKVKEDGKEISFALIAKK